MSRRQLQFLLVSLVALVVVQHSPASSEVHASGRPNFLVIMTDDQAASLYRFMPRIQSDLAAGGIVFENFFLTSPVCCPSRATLFTGRYAHNHGVRDNRGPDGGVERYRANGHEQSNLAVWLDDAGYRTGLFGKYMNGYGLDEESTYVPEGWDTWCAKLEQGIGYFDFKIHRDGDTRSYTRETTATHELDVLADHAEQFIRDAVRTGQPFFALMTPFSPHANGKLRPPDPPARLLGIFDSITAPRVPSFNEADNSDKPPWARQHGLMSEAEVAVLDELYRRSAEVVLGVDETVGRMLDLLRRVGVLDDTYVFFLSDNGFQFGEHRLIGKGKAYEESARAPLIVRGPDITPARVSTELVANTDLAPTIIELVGAAPTATFDGRSLVPLFRGEPQSWRAAVLLENWRAKAPPDDLSAVLNWRALRTHELKYTEYDGPDEAYVLTSDPFELVNTLERDAKRDDLSVWVSALQACSAGECRRLEDDRPRDCSANPDCVGPACDPCRMSHCGDLNSDGRVTVADALGVLSSLVRGQTCELCRCDVDGDGRTTVRDPLALLANVVRGNTVLACPPCSP